MPRPIDAPEWAWVLLSAVEEFEDIHPKLDECLSDALGAVPVDARVFAAGIRHHIRQTSNEETR